MADDKAALAVAETVTGDEPRLETAATLASDIAPRTTTRVELQSELRAVPDDVYEIGRELARGGMGRIVTAFDRRIGRTVALKELLVASPELVERFEREALITGRLQHPAIVPVYEVGHLGANKTFYAMKHVAGRPLDVEIAKCESLAQRLTLLPKALVICQAMAYAHREGVIHRDLKPANVIVGEFGETVVLDWGLAKRIADSESERTSDVVRRYESQGADEGLTTFGAVMGTPAYMPPEQARGEAVDVRADVYSLGAILRQILTGVPPYRGDTTTAILSKVMQGAIEPLAATHHDVPRDLAAIVDKAMAADPAARYQAVEPLVADLQRYLDGQLVGAHAYSTFALVRRWVRRHRSAVAVGAAALCVLAILGAVAFDRVAGERDVARRERTDADRARALAVAREQDALAQQRLAEGRGLVAAASAAVARHRVDEAVALLRAAARPELGDAGSDEARRAGFVELATRSLPRILSTGSDGIASLAFSPDGSRLVAGTSRGRVVVLDPASGATITTGYHDDDTTWGVGAIAFSPDGSQLVTVGATETRVWQGATGSVLRTHPMASSTMLQGAWFSPDGTVIASKQGDRLAVLWRAATGERLGAVDANGSALAFAPDSKTVASGTLAGDVKLTDTTGVVRHVLRGGRSAVYAIVYSSDGARLAATFADGELRVWDVSRTSPVAIATRKTDPARSLAFSPDDSVLVLRTMKDLQLFEGRTIAPISTQPTAGDRGVFHERLAFARGGRLLATHAGFNAVGLWDVTSGLRVDLFPGSTTVSTFAFSPDGARLAVGLQDGKIQVWTIRVALPAHTIARGDTLIQQAEVSSDGRFVALLAGGTIRIWSNGATHTLAVEQVESFALSSGVLVTGGRGVHLWDLATGVAVAKLTDDEVNLVSVSPDGTAVLAGNTLWDLRQRRQLASLGSVIELAGWSDDGALLAGFGRRGSPGLWNARTGQPLPLADGPDDGVVQAVAISRDHRWLVAGYEDRTVRIWEIATGKLVRTIEETGPWGVHAVELSADGERIAIGHNNRASLWSRSTGQLITRLEGHEPLQGNPSFLPDGRILTPSKAAHVWDGRDGASLFAFPAEGTGMSMLPELARTGTHFVTYDTVDKRGIFVWRVPPARSVEDARTESGRETNLRVCRDSYRVVPVIPVPLADTYWAPEDKCK